MPKPSRDALRTPEGAIALRACALAGLALLLGLLALLPGESALRGLRVVPEATRVSGERFPLELHNGAARTSVATPPRRIASVAVTADEILADFAISERIVGVSRFADDPRASSAVGRFPSRITRLHGEAESIVSLSPDFTIVSGYTHAERVALLESAGSAVFRLGRPQSFAAIDETIRRLGVALGARERADALRAQIEERLETVARSVAGRPRPRVLFLSWAGYTSGPGTLLDEMIGRAGGYNVARDAGIEGTMPLSLELALSLRPEAVLTTGGAPGSADSEPGLRRDPRWSQVEAVRSGRLFALDSALALSTSHHAARAVAQIAAWLHPESGP
ncbi:MAG: ABC transporter substrate-binding protein [Myxococcales bacterium]|nr:ABC transporter substrate-binding protein [Myxococcales bacterium]